MLSRRSLIHGLGAAAGAGLLLGPGRSALGQLRSVLTAEADGFIHLRAAPSIVSLLGPGKPNTPVWAYNDQVPGPELRVKAGQPIRVRLHNGLPDTTTIHWHGMHLPNRMDGVPGLTQRPVEPGETFDYEFTPPYAGTYWYHSHFRTEEQSDRGLYGPLIVEEPSPMAVDRDLWLIIDDWRLLDNGCIDEATFGDRREWAREGRLGNVFTINGTVAPTFRASRGERVRLRCVNASNAKVLAFDLPGLPLWLIAWDGQTLPEPVRYANRNIDLGPGQRADFFIDIPGNAPDQVVPRMFSSGQAIPLTTLEIDGPQRAPRSEALVLTPSVMTPLDLTRTRRADVLIQGGSQSARLRGGRNIKATRDEGLFWTLNGVFGGPHEGLGTGPPLVEAKKGETVIVNMINQTFYPHAMHLHGHHFRVVERNGKSVQPGPWRDVEVVPNDESAAFAFVAGEPGKWLYHCHMVEHHAAGMGGWFNITA